MNETRPLCRFSLSKGSILDTLFINDQPRRPTYATTTEGSVTTLWCVNPRGKLLEVARIHWEGDSASAYHSTVVVNGQTMLVENVLQKSKGFFRSDSRTFAAGAIKCKWKRAKSPTSQNWTTSRTWTASAWMCYETSPPQPQQSPTASTPSSYASSQSAPPIAVFFPPQSGLVKSEVTIYPSASTIVDHIILTAILICAQKDEWRVAQSALSRTALEASLKAELRGTLPAYAPATSSRHRPSSSQLRRPHSANTVRPRRGPTPDPPPYTTMDDSNLRRC
ncbi:hypothetical protein BU17DRAFT_93501 [Hysterangium stoloniferum]|nr:hypothetical protein BU17DRAFT_93501 [Hysterangium stoloniferum]